jgi:hypothetical protein
VPSANSAFARAQQVLRDAGALEDGESG